MVSPYVRKFIAVAVLVATLIISSVEPKEGTGCLSSAASYDGTRIKYNVILADQQTEQHLTWLSECHNRPNTHVTSNTFSTKSEDKNIITDFSVQGLYGYNGWFDAKFVEDQLKPRSDVLIIEADAPVKINAPVKISAAPEDTQLNPNPNLDRINQQKFPLDKKYTFPASAGAGATVYVVDTGIRTTHKEFENRAIAGGAFCTGCPNTDDNGHGSHVTGIIAGKNFGVAKKANIIGVKVLDANGTGSNSFVINGLSFVLADVQKKKNKAVVNMSLGGTLSAAVNAAVKSLTDAGVHVAVAAGNEGADACKDSPSSELSAITVGATEDINDAVTDFSNIGKCVDIFAPGRNILSVGIQSDTDTQVFSGTSQATPHVAGTVALIIGDTGNSSPADMTKKLLDLSTKNIIPAGGLKGSPNNFLRVPSC